MVQLATYKDATINSSYPIISIHDLKITASFNNHGRLHLTGLLQADKALTVVEQASSADTIEVFINESGKQVKLFSGIVDEFNVTHDGGVYHFSLVAVTHTDLLDHKKVNRSFQNQSMSYGTLINWVLAEYNGHFIQIPTDRSIGRMIIQYQETTWQFLKRIATHFETVLIPDLVGNQPRLSCI